MSHDRGCFVCFDDLPPRKAGCGRLDCPYRPETLMEKHLRETREVIRRKDHEEYQRLKAERAMG